MRNGLFRYNLNQTESRVLPGSHKYVAMVSEKYFIFYVMAFTLVYKISTSMYSTCKANRYKQNKYRALVFRVMI